MLIHTSKEVSPAVYVQHDPFPLVIYSLPLLKITAHLDPFRFELCVLPPPLPPCLPTNFVDTLATQLGYQGCGSVRDGLFRDDRFLDLDPSRRRHPL